jgi:adenosylhomocysteine nucleosidase
LGSDPGTPGIVVGLTAEARIARGLGWPVAAGGGTAAGAARAAAKLIARGVGGLVSFGLAGGLDPALPAGAVIVPGAILLDEQAWPTDAALSARLGDDGAETLLAGSEVLATADAKAAAFARTGCAAVDLESGAVARAAREAGLPFAALRAVCDPAGRNLPPAALAALDAEGGIVLMRVLASLARRPNQLPAIMALGSDAARARRALLDRVAQLARGGAPP